jgi:hypothetical protein
MGGKTFTKVLILPNLTVADNTDVILDAEGDGTPFSLQSGSYMVTGADTNIN